MGAAGTGFQVFRPIVEPATSMIPPARSSLPESSHYAAGCPSPLLSRKALSRKLCEVWDWRQPNGCLRDMVCRGLMPAAGTALPALRYALAGAFVSGGLGCVSRLTYIALAALQWSLSVTACPIRLRVVASRPWWSSRHHRDLTAPRHAAGGVRSPSTASSPACGHASSDPLRGSLNSRTTRRAADACCTESSTNRRGPCFSPWV